LSILKKGKGEKRLPLALDTTLHSHEEGVKLLRGEGKLHQRDP
jgi:hypothetical protein